MFGLGIVKGLGVTLKHFIETYIDDLKYFPKSMVNEQAFAHRQGPDGGRGLFTVEYPEMKLKTPENFRFVPFLVTDYEVAQDSPEFERAKWLELNRCTSCGICAKVCPPQCIWIVRTNDPATGKPIPQPAEFYIDIDICMNCGYCAEFCPFDAIKMDHDFELADYDREAAHIHDLGRLLKPASYYAAIRPTWNAKEEAAKQAAEEEKRRKEEEKQRLAAEKAAAAAAAKAQAEATAKAEAAAGDQPAAQAKRSPEEIKAQREAMLARKKAGGEAPVEAAEAVAKSEAAVVAAAAAVRDQPAAKPKRTPEEIKAQREAMMAKRAGHEAPTPAAAQPAAVEEPAAKPKRTPEEIKAQRDAIMAKRAGRGTPAPAAIETPAVEAPVAQSEPARAEIPAQPEAVLIEPAGQEQSPARPVEPVKAEAEAAAPPAAPPTEPDDLTKIEGIGPKISGLLQAAGITTFAQLAQIDVDRLQQILAEAGPRFRLADPASWAQQASLAATGQWDELEKLQKQLTAGRNKE